MTKKKIKTKVEVEVDIIKKEKVTEGGEVGEEVGVIVGEEKDIEETRNWQEIIIEILFMENIN